MCAPASSDHSDGKSRKQVATEERAKAKAEAAEQAERVLEEERQAERTKQRLAPKVALAESIARRPRRPVDAAESTPQSAPSLLGRGDIGSHHHDLQ